MSDTTPASRALAALDDMAAGTYCENWDAEGDRYRVDPRVITCAPAMLALARAAVAERVAYRAWEAVAGTGSTDVAPLSAVLHDAGRDRSAVTDALIAALDPPDTTGDQPGED